MNNKPIVSIIIPTYNSAKTLDACLKSVRAQSYRNIEIIVVDNYSADTTKQISELQGAYFFQKGPERSTQRNFGAKKSRGEYLIFIDSDMELTPIVVEKCIEKMDQDNIACIIIPEISFGEGFWAQCKALEKECYIGDDTIEAARFFKREIFFSHQGYDEEIAGGGEDWDLPQRIKNNDYSISRINALIKHNEGNLTLFGTMKKKYYYAKTFHKYIKKHPSVAKKQFKLIRPAFTRNWKKLVRRPVHALGMFFMKFCEACASIVGLMSTKKR